MPQPLPPWRLLREPAVIAATGYSRASIRRLAKRGEFPSPVKVGTGQGGAVAWREDEVLAWLEARQAGCAWIPKNTGVR
jgi:prophage regulatory protein